MADDILAQFQEFLEAKKAEESAQTEAEDFEVEIGRADGSYVRTRRSHAKPLLQSFGIDVDESGTNDAGNDASGESGKDKSKGSRQGKAPAAGSSSTVRKYFTKPAGK